MFQDFKGTYTSVYGSAFKLGHPKTEARSRTTPLPRFKSNGHRDYYQSPDAILNQGGSDEGSGFQYGSDELSRFNQQSFLVKLHTTKILCKDHRLHERQSIQRLSSPGKVATANPPNFHKKELLSSPILKPGYVKI